LNRELRVILIGGSSNIGKSTLAEHLAARLGWSHTSTDRLARHPGRPWRSKPDAVPPHVAEHYLNLSTDELISSVLGHYRETVWPIVDDLVRKHAEDTSTERLVLEGSALLPEKVAQLQLQRVAAIWLTGDDDLFKTRIQAISGYEYADEAGKMMVDKFLDRTCRFTTLMMEAVVSLDLPFIEVEQGASVETIADQCLERFRS
jgi:2-phosphoglycerate kinase